jgi:hypothetical protein
MNCLRVTADLLWAVHAAQSSVERARAESAVDPQLAGGWASLDCLGAAREAHASRYAPRAGPSLLRVLAWPHRQ